MAGHTVVHGWPDASLKARESGSRFAALRKWRLDDRRAAFTNFRWVRHEPWVTEEAAGRRRGLIEDNPASG